jgi:hypothetical protein
VLWLHGYGNVFEKVLAPGEQIDVEPGGWVFRDQTVEMEIKVMGLKSGSSADPATSSSIASPDPAARGSSRCTSTGRPPPELSRGQSAPRRTPPRPLGLPVSTLARRRPDGPGVRECPPTNLLDQLTVLNVDALASQNTCNVEVAIVERHDRDIATSVSRSQPKPTDEPSAFRDSSSDVAVRDVQLESPKKDRRVSAKLVRLEFDAPKRPAPPRLVQWTPSAVLDDSANEGHRSRCYAAARVLGEVCAVYAPLAAAGPKFVWGQPRVYGWRTPTDIGGIGPSHKPPAPPRGASHTLTQT